MGSGGDHRLLAGKPGPGAVWNSAGLAGELLRALREGRPDAENDIATVLRGQIPPGPLRALRDAHLRRLAQMIRIAFPEMTLEALAAMIEAAGQRVEGGGSLATLPALAGLSTDEAAAIERTIKSMLRWLPTHHRRQWLTARRIRSIVTF